MFTPHIHEVSMAFKLHLLAFLVLLLSCSDDPEPPGSLQFSDDPNNISIVTSDIDLFWSIHDQANGDYQEHDFLERYFRAGTESLSQFFETKIQTASKLTQKLSDEHYHLYYLSIRENSENIDIASIQFAMNQLELSYPASVFSDVILVIGALGTGGTVVKNGNMVIGVEFFTKGPNTSTDQLSPWMATVTRSSNYLPSIVLHELIHVQQRNFAIRENLKGENTLLELSLAEGIADFVTNLILGIYFNDHLPDYADPLEKDLWFEFKSEMLGTDTEKWLFNAATSENRPGDLGYYVGYKIAEHYYFNQPDKSQALKGLLEIRNAEGFLELSDYESKF